MSAKELHDLGVAEAGRALMEVPYLWLRPASEPIS